jgi:hypothetical protein
MLLYEGGSPRRLRLIVEPLARQSRRDPDPIGTLHTLSEAMFTAMVEATS